LIGVYLRLKMFSAFSAAPDTLRAGCQPATASLFTLVQAG